MSSCYDVGPVLFRCGVVGWDMVHWFEQIKKLSSKYQHGVRYFTPCGRTLPRHCCWCGRGLCIKEPLEKHSWLRHSAMDDRTDRRPNTRALGPNVYCAVACALCGKNSKRVWDGSIQLGREQHLRPLNHTGLDCANRSVVAPSGEWTWHVQKEVACYSSMMKSLLAMVNDKK